jgi:hypothetical protein
MRWMLRSGDMDTVSEYDRMYGVVTLGAYNTELYCKTG